MLFSDRSRYLIIFNLQFVQTKQSTVDIAKYLCLRDLRQRMRQPVTKDVIEKTER